jgi:hypothetical protein
MTRIKRWRRIVFDAELDCLSGCLAGKFGSNSEPKIDAGSDTTRSDHVAISNNPGPLVRGPNERQQIGKGPMGCCPPSFEQPGDTQNECAGADRGNILCRGVTVGKARESGFARDSPLEGDGFELVWGFSCQVVVFGFFAGSLFGAGKAVLRPVACDQVRGARGRGQGTETVAQRP